MVRTIRVRPPRARAHACRRARARVVVADLTIAATDGATDRCEQWQRLSLWLTSLTLLAQKHNPGLHFDWIYTVTAAATTTYCLVLRRYCLGNTGLHFEPILTGFSRRFFSADARLRQVTAAAPLPQCKSSQNADLNCASELIVSEKSQLSLLHVQLNLNSNSSCNACH